MTPSKKRLTVADLAKTVDKLNRKLTAQGKLLQTYEGLISEGHEILDLQERMEKVEAVTPVDGVQTLLDAVQEQNENLFRQPITSDRLQRLERKMKDMERVQQKRDKNTVDLITTEQNKRKALEHYNSNRIDEIKALEEVVKTLGPLWKSAAGHTKPIALLSTSHLQALRAGTWVHNPDTRRFIRKELDRRAEDKRWRVLQGDAVENEDIEPRLNNIEKRLDAHGKQINRLKSDKFATGGVVPPTNCTQTVYVDAFGNCTGPDGRPVEPSVEEVVAGHISDIKDDVKELQLDLNQQHSMIDIHGNRLDNLEDKGEEPEVGPDFISPLVFPDPCQFKFMPRVCQGDHELISYTITHGKRNGKPFISYGDVKTTTKRGFFRSLFSFLRLGR